MPGMHEDISINKDKLAVAGWDSELVYIFKIIWNEYVFKLRSHHHWLVTFTTQNSYSITKFEFESHVIELLFNLTLVNQTTLWSLMFEGSGCKVWFHYIFLEIMVYFLYFWFDCLTVFFVRGFSNKIYLCIDFQVHVLFFVVWYFDWFYMTLTFQSLIKKTKTIQLSHSLCSIEVNYQVSL